MCRLVVVPAFLFFISSLAAQELPLDKLAVGQAGRLTHPGEIRFVNNGKNRIPTLDRLPLVATVDRVIDANNVVVRTNFVGKRLWIEGVETKSLADGQRVDLDFVRVTGTKSLDGATLLHVVIGQAPPVSPSGASLPEVPINFYDTWSDFAVKSGRVQRLAHPKTGRPMTATIFEVWGDGLIVALPYKAAGIWIDIKAAPKGSVPGGQIALPAEYLIGSRQHGDHKLIALFPPSK